MCLLAWLLPMNTFLDLVVQRSGKQDDYYYENLQYF